MCAVGLAHPTPAPSSSPLASVINIINRLQMDPSQGLLVIPIKQMAKLREQAPA